MCRASNLQSILTEQDLQEDLREVLEVYEHIKREDSRGTRISDDVTLQSNIPPIAASNSRTMPSNPTTAEVALDRGEYEAICNLLNQDRSSTTYASRYQLQELSEPLPPRREILWHKGVYSGEVFLKGVTCSTSGKGRNILVMGDDENPVHAARLEKVITHTRRSGSANAQETFLIVRKLIPLEVRDRPRDLYRQFGWCGGFLCYHRYNETVEAIKPSSFICHFGRTQLSIDGISEECVHVLPQSRVSYSKILSLFKSLSLLSSPL